MINHCNKILYIGTGCDIQPVTHFLQTKEFIFIDSQPRNEFDSFYPKFQTHFYRSHFYSHLLESCRKYGFILESTYEFDSDYHKTIMSWKQKITHCFKKLPDFINPTLLVFKNNITNQTINYYISTNIKFNMKPILQLDIEDCDGIIISGHHPDIELLQYIKHPIDFFGYTGTCYTIENNNLYNVEKQNIIYFLQTCTCNIKYYFKDFFSIFLCLFNRAVGLFLLLLTSGGNKCPL